MTCHRKSLSSVAVLLVSAALLALAAAPALGVASKVVLLTRNGAGEGQPAATGETAHIANFVTWSAQSSVCLATFEQATVGKNTSGTVKVTAAGQPPNMFCFQENSSETVQGHVAITSISVSRTGAVKLVGDLELTAGQCSYRAVKLTGVQNFGEKFTEPLTGTAKRAPHSATTCAATAPIEDFISVSDAAGHDYVVELTP